MRYGTRDAENDSTAGDGDRAEYGRAEWRPRHVSVAGLKYASLHGAFWPDNLIWDADSLVAVLDWEDAAFGHPVCAVARGRLVSFNSFDLKDPPPNAYMQWPVTSRDSEYNRSDFVFNFIVDDSDTADCRPT